MTAGRAAQPGPSPEYPAEVNARLLTVWDDVQERVKMADTSRILSIERLARQVRQAGRRRQRVLWLHRTADAFAQAFDGLAACKSGCAHCCHIPLSLGEHEAAEIGAAIGRKPRPAREHVPLQEVAAIGMPCTFLNDEQRCAIYEVRPSICRTHLSLDKDNLLCRLVPGAAVPVPYANALQIQALTAVATGPTFADIRQWFA